MFPPGVKELGTILKGFCIARPRHVPLREYLEVISASEAERLRQIVTEIINRTGGNPEQLQAELEKFNQEVARWRKLPFHWVQEQVDLLGLGLDLAFLNKNFLRGFEPRTRYFRSNFSRIQDIIKIKKDSFIFINITPLKPFRNF
ncbi:MAG: hypothetical protein QHH75_14810 [Bacillota bacterium]|nr:hypothetical protein [Bacillota bacterium]